MERYSNNRGNSPVTHFAIGSDNITVWFAGGKAYTYSYRKAGRTHVEHMKVLARSGSGLSAYITQNVRFLYD